MSTKATPPHAIHTAVVKLFADELVQLTVKDHSFTMAQAGKVQSIAHRMESLAREADGEQP